MRTIVIDGVRSDSASVASKSGHVWKSMLSIEPSDSILKYGDRH